MKRLRNLLFAAVLLCLPVFALAQESVPAEDPCPDEFSQAVVKDVGMHMDAAGASVILDPFLEPDVKVLVFRGHCTERSNLGDKPIDYMQKQIAELNGAAQKNGIKVNYVSALKDFSGGHFFVVIATPTAEMIKARGDFRFVLVVVFNDTRVVNVDLLTGVDGLKQP